MKKHGPWTIESTSERYRSNLIEVNEDQVIRPDGAPGIYTTVKIKEGIAVLAVDEEQNAYLAQEFRYALARDSLEAVCGSADEGESMPDAAKRELLEELGIAADELIPLGRVDPLTSIVDSPSHLFLARGLRFMEHQQEETETIRMIKLPLREAVKKALNSEITHGASCTLIFRANDYLQSRQ